MQSSGAVIIFLLAVSLVSALSSAQECAPGERRAQSEKRLISNGCSKPPGLGIAGEENFTYCCDRHDACYESCGASKEYCDREFSECMKALCQSNFAKNSDCKSAAETYFMGVSFFGQGGFDDSQNQHCTCIDAAKVDDHYTSLVSNFYETHVSTTKTKEEIEALVKGKGGSARRLAMLIFNLYRKYGQAIEHDSVRSKQTAVPPRSATSGEL